MHASRCLWAWSIEVLLSVSLLSKELQLVLAQDAGQFVAQHHPALALRQGRFGWDLHHLAGLGSYDHHVAALLFLSDVASKASLDVMAAASEACRHIEERAFLCDLQRIVNGTDFNRSLRAARDHAYQQLRSLGHDVPRWTALPVNWKVLPLRGRSRDGFQQLLSDGRHTLFMILQKMMSLNEGQHLVPVEWWFRVLERVHKITGMMMTLGDRFTAAVTLQTFGPRLETILPGSSTQHVQFDEFGGRLSAVHHVDILDKTLGADARRQCSHQLDGRARDISRSNPDTHVESSPTVAYGDCGSIWPASCSRWWGRRC